MSRLRHGAVQPHARYVPPQRVLAVLSTSPEGSPHPDWAARAATVSIDAEFSDNTSGVLYALGGSGGGLTLYMDKGQLVYEYNMMIIEWYIARSSQWSTSSTFTVPPATRHTPPWEAHRLSDCSVQTHNRYSLA